MTEAAHPAGHRAAADYLRRLLLKPGPYQNAWQQHVARPRGGVVNQLAVIEVISNYLRTTADPIEPRVPADQLRQMVGEALSGRHVSRRSMQLFIDAFSFDEDETNRLWRLWSGASTIRVLSGNQAAPIEVDHDVARALGPRRHHTLMLHDHIWIDAYGRIDRSRIMQTIEAIVEGVENVPLLADTNVLTVELGRGCKELAGPIRRIANGVFEADIMLAARLEMGATAGLEYWCTYQYPGDLTDPRELRWRRAVLRRLENYEIRIEFHPDRLPGRLWWATWDGGATDEVLDQQQVRLDSQHSAHRFLSSVEKTIVGFHWAWS